MKKIIVCIGSNDGKNLSISHLGDATYFYIYEIYEDLNYKFLYKKENIIKEMEHAKGEKMKSVLNLIGETDILIAYYMSPNFKNIARKTKYQPVIIQEKPIEKAIEIIKSNFNDLLDIIQKRKNGIFTDYIPNLKL